MKKILLLLSTTRTSPRSVAKALELAQKEQAELLLLFVLDDALAQSVIDKMSEEGWVGGKPSQDLQNSILKKYFTQGQVKLKEIEEEAAKCGVTYRSIYARGDFAPVALGVIAREGVDLIIVARRKRSDLSRFIFGSPVAEIQKKAGCEIMLIDE